jgi:hypothetical protein
MPSDANIMEIRNDFKELPELFSVSTVRRPFRESPQDNKRRVECLIANKSVSRPRAGGWMRIANVLIPPSTLETNCLIQSIPSRGGIDGRSLGLR